jgi:uncharacterized protein YdcH (DUF465 family)
MKNATLDFMAQVNKNFFMFDKLIDDLEKLEANKKDDEDYQEPMTVAEVQRLKDTFLKLVGKLLEVNYDGCKAFFTDKKA